MYTGGGVAGIPVTGAQLAQTGAPGYLTLAVAITTLIMAGLGVIKIAKKIRRRA